MSKEDFEELVVTKMKEIVDAYRQLGEDDYISLCWCNDAISAYNAQPKGTTPDINVFVNYPEEE